MDRDAAAEGDQARRTAARAARLRKKLARIDVSDRALITEPETPADPSDPAAQAPRNRIRARFTELYGERTSIEAVLAVLRACGTASEPAAGHRGQPAREMPRGGGQRVGEGLADGAAVACAAGFLPVPVGDGVAEAVAGAGE